MVGHVAAGARYWRSQLHACYFYHQKKAKSACLCLANLNESTFFVVWKDLMVTVQIQDGLMKTKKRKENGLKKKLSEMNFYFNH